jgi:hypothetical protein
MADDLARLCIRCLSNTLAESYTDIGVKTLPPQALRATHSQAIEENFRWIEMLRVVSGVVGELEWRDLAYSNWLIRDLP